MPETYKEKMNVRGREREVTVVKCDCGDKVWCPEFTQTCSCGADYNMSGQRLAPRDQWGEETGEHWSDCY
jgi:hypothetical protein